MKRGLITAGLIAFLLVDIVLVYVALRPPPVTPAAVGIPTGSSTDGAASTTPPRSTSQPQTSPTGSGTTGPTGTANLRPRPVGILLVGLDSDVAWKATTGTCRDGGATLSLTRDGGSSWDEVKVPPTTISRVQVLSAGTGFVVGADRGCGENEFTTDDNGGTWTGPRPLVGGWARKLAQPKEIVTPEDGSSRPCGDQNVLDLSRTSAEQAEALCLDGSVKVTNDSGATWSESGEAEGALAFSNRLEGGSLTTYAARAGIEGCPGVQVVKVVRGKKPAEVACVKTPMPTPGSVAISASSQAGWLVVGDQTWVSGADLTTWEQA
ncbi:hypothetical protein [Intrasporangium sp.]|jgi:hypothetical protein|uniref:hypothetical protein n=1 Tax=Intrasporangium sp. TaxID=1925024 RepID=UPI0033657E93